MNKDKVVLCAERFAPPGWTCTRELGHDGPCAAVPKKKWYQKLGGGLGTALGEFLFGGSR
jgi:hypothetical protein